MQRNSISVSRAIKDIATVVTEGDWLLVDLDNTIQESVIELGSDQWFSALIRHASEVIVDKEEAMVYVIAVYQAVQHHIKTKAVEAETAALIKAVQDKGIPVFALTARDSSLIEPTFRQLDGIGVEFSKSKSERDTSIVLNTEVVYCGRIIFCNGKNKGESLNHFFESKFFEENITTKPKRIVMADDKAHHLESTEKCSKDLGIDFVGLHYNYLDDKVKNFDMKKANQQLACLQSKLPDKVQEIIAKLKLTEAEEKDSVIDCSSAFFFKPQQQEQDQPDKNLNMSSSSKVARM